MASLTPKEIEAIEGICKDYRIKFLGLVEATEWPEPHKVILQDITELGQRKFSTYTVDESGVDNSPWKTTLKNLARNLVERAKRNIQRNEDTWRFACEPYVFARFQAEVACRMCRGRVWRSEIEVSADTKSRSGQSLATRQKNREPCRCPRMARDQDHLEAIGLNRIFNQRQEEIIQLEAPVAKRLGKRRPRVDAVYGLRQTRNIENLLNDTRRRTIHDQGDYGGSRLLYEDLRPSPLDQPLSQNGEELLYPFLVTEAKSGTAGCDWHSVNMQTALPIWKFLQAQQRLHDEAKTTTARSELVWFVSNRGDDWRLSLGYVEKGILQGNANYTVLDVWRGSIFTLDGALQLLLLIDYIFDWARDIYRVDIIRKLRSLASGDNDAASTICSDTDIFSTRVPVRQDVHPAESDGAQDPQLTGHISPEIYATDEEWRAVRQASPVENRFCCVFVTRDNIELLFDSLVPTRGSRDRLLAAVSMNHGDLMLMDASMIADMEKQWTGQQRLAPTATGNRRPRFYTKVTCSSYLSSTWDQIRELYVIAFDTQIWPVVEQACPVSQPTITPSAAPSSKSLLDHIDFLQAGSMADTLLACINRRCIQLRHVSMMVCLSCRLSGPENCPKADTHFDFMGLELTTSDGWTRNLVHYIYKTMKRGVVEPTESFIRFSTCLIPQHLLPPVKDTAIRSPSANSEELQQSDHGCVLIQGRPSKQETARSPATLCMYVLAPESQDDSGKFVTNYVEDRAKMIYAFRTRDIYYTTLNNGPSSLASLAIRTSTLVPWNISGTYGMYMTTPRGPDTLETLAFSESLSWDVWDVPSCLDRIGAPRIEDGAKSGSYLLKRRLDHWEDPRQQKRRESRAYDMFWIYKLMTQEFEYWKQIAAERNKSGMRSCIQCAENTGAAEDHTICRQYVEASSLGGSLYWMREFFDRDQRENMPRLSSLSPSTDQVESDIANEENEPPLLDSRWYKILQAYPELEEPFEGMLNLHSRASAFYRWYDGQRQQGRKRRRLADDD